MTGKILYTLTFVLFLSNFVLGQKTEKLLSTYAYDKASVILEKKVNRSPDDYDARLELARTFAKTGHPERSLFHYNQIVHSNSLEILTDADWNNVAHYNFAFGNLSEANFAFKKIVSNDEFLKFNFPDRTTYYTIDKLDLNSQYSDFSPFLFNDQLVFTSDRPKSIYDLNKSKWSGNPYLSLLKVEEGNAKMFDAEFSDQFHVGPASYSKENQWLFVTKTNKNKVSEVQRAKIYISRMFGEEWTGLQEIEGINSNEFSNAHPVYIDKYKMLVFASDRPGGYGGMDLYYSKYENQTWSEPLNFGDSINTRFNDVFPCYSEYTPNNLYFSSNGYLGYGGLDVFSFDLSNSDGERPNLLAKSINSEYDDFGIYFENEKDGYISSNRISGDGLDDIYKFHLSETVLISGVIVDKKNRPLENKKLYLSTDDNTVFDSLYTDSKGFFQYRKLPYQSVLLKPESENETEMVIRPFQENLGKDMTTNVVFASSSSERIDSISLASFTDVKLVLESFDEIEKRCVEYNNGEKAADIKFVVRDAKGNFLEKAQTNRRGCLILKKLYGDNVYLELDEEEDVQLGIRFSKSENEQFSLKSNDGVIVLTRAKKCVEFENGDAVSNFYFVVKDDKGNVIDSLKTDSLGCFNLQKLYAEGSYLEIADEDLYDLGIRIKNKEETKSNWQKIDHSIVLIAPSKCLVFMDGSAASNQDLVIKNKDGEVIGDAFTDDNGCFYLKKLFHENDFLEFEDEEGVTLQARMKKDEIVLLQKAMKEGVTSLRGKIEDYPKGNTQKDVEVLLLSESGVVQKRTVVSDIGEFEFQKLSNDAKMFVQIVDDQQLLLNRNEVKVKGNLKKGTENLTDMVIYLMNNNGSKFASDDLDNNGDFELSYNPKKYLIQDTIQQEKFFEGITKNKVNQTVIQNIYFGNSKWDIDIEAEKVIDELVDIMRINKNLQIIINAHTDSRGSNESNISLSKKRALSVSSYIIDQGVNKNRVKSNGFGESKLINDCDDQSNCSEEEHAKNRRIEFEFVWAN